MITEATEPGRGNMFQGSMLSRISRWLLLPCAAITLAANCLAQEAAEERPTPTLAELVSSADLVAVVRVLDTDYEYTREFPSGGTAFLQVLIPYKVSRPLEDIVEVYEEGLREGECYFENPTVLEEGRRHLVFLRLSEDVEDQYNGLEAGCKLDVLVTDENRYALRYPLRGLPIADDVSGLVRALTYQDAYAVVEEDDITPPERISLLEQGYLEVAGEQRFRFTHGIPLEEFRSLVGPDLLTLDRSLKQVQSRQ